jgi:hypothetical protein
LIISGLKSPRDAARANFKSLVPARLHRIEGSRVDFSITSLRVPFTRVSRDTCPSSYHYYHKRQGLRSSISPIHQYVHEYVPCMYTLYYIILHVVY